MTFQEGQDRINREAVTSLLSCGGAPLMESQLLQAAFTPQVNTADALELYQSHFLLFNLLYTLQRDY